MNFRFVINQFGLLCIVLSGIMLLTAGCFYIGTLIADYDLNEQAMQALLFTGLAVFVFGLVIWLLTHGMAKTLGRREAMLLVAFSWIGGAIFAALPYFVWAHIDGEVSRNHPFNNFFDCYFEAMSGLTTTGATVLGTPDHPIENIPRSLLLWRSFTHWLGGLGIVVLFVAVFPSLGVSSKRLFRMETTGPSKAGVLPNIRDTARILGLIYIALTLMSMLSLWLIGRMNLFDSICHSFSMISTGGLSTRDASIGHFNSVAVDVICCVFMIAAGVNFGLFYQMTRGRFRVAWKDPELRVFLWLKFLVIIVVCLNLYHTGQSILTTTGESVEPTLGQSLRYSSFTTIALHTGTGFCTTEYDPWPFLSRGLLIGLMFIGGCAGSTAGGVKVIRIWIMLKVFASEIEKIFRPHVVRPVRVGGASIDQDTKLSAVVYVLGFLLTFGIGTVLIELCEPQVEDGGRCDFLTAMSASLSTLANVGPGLHEVSATKNYGWFTSESKAVMSLLMALGRIEMFAIIVLFTPRFWRGD